MSKESKGGSDKKTMRLAEYLFEESNKATGRRRVEDVERLLSSLEEQRTFRSLEPSSILVWAKDEIPKGRFESVPWFFLAMGKYFESIGKWDDAAEWYHLAADRTAKTGNRSIELDASVSLGHLLAKRGNRKAADQLYRYILKKTRAEKNETGTMRVLGGMGALRFDEGDFAGARRFLREVIRISDRSGDELWKAHMLNDLGAVWSADGKRSKARSSYERALEIYRSRGYEKGAARCLHNLGIESLESGDLSAAGEQFRKSFDLAGPAGWEELLILNLLGRAEVLTGIREYDTSLTLSSEALERAANLGDPYSMLEAESLKAFALYGTGDRKGSHRSLEESISLAGKVKARYPLARIFQRRAFLYLSEGKTSRARTDLERALDLYDSMGLETRKRPVDAILKKINGKGG